MAQTIDTKATLWQNVSALMREHYGKENLTRLAKDCCLGPATITRIKEQKTSVGLEVIEQIAARFHIDPWQLMVPGMDPKSPPVLQPINDRERKLYESIMSAAKLIAADAEPRNSEWKHDK